MPVDRDPVKNIQTIQLRALAALAEQGSYTRVARSLSYTEPAVNMQIKSLERTLGLPLVRREGKRILLTNQGMHLLPLVNSVLEQNHQLEIAARRLQVSDSVVVGGGRNTGVYHLMPLLSEYRELTGEDPDLHILSAEDLVMGIVEGQLDVVVAGIRDNLLPRLDRMRHHIVRIPWKHEQLVMVAAAVIGARRLPLRPGGTTTVFIPPYFHLDDAELVEVCRPYFSDVRLASLETADAVKSAVANGLGAGLLPFSAVREDECITVLGFVRRSINSTGCMHVVHLRPRLLSPGTRRFVSFLETAPRRQRMAAR